jgi:hypothetical protein
MVGFGRRGFVSKMTHSARPLSLNINLIVIKNTTLKTTAGPFRCLGPAGLPAPTVSIPRVPGARPQLPLVASQQLALDTQG